MNKKTKRACITGAFGQDGSYLSEHLLEEGYQVMGLVHGDDVSINASISEKLTTHPNFTLCVGNFSDLHSFGPQLDAFGPDEIYNLAAISDLKTAREYPELTMDINFYAVRNLVEHSTSIFPNVRIFQALSSRILTPDTEGVISEKSPLMEPQNAYDEAKRASYEEVVLPYRNKGFFVASGFLCNHESPRRGDRFVTGKIAQSVARIAEGREDILHVGNVFAKRDWSYAGDFARAMHTVLNLESSDDFVIGSGQLHTVQNFIDLAFGVTDTKLTWEGSGVDTKAHDREGALRVAIDERFYQSDDNPVVSDTSKIREVTGWLPQVSFEELVTLMVQAELEKQR
jgi:GDPmannose 4,6-dehydratase